MSTRRCSRIVNTVVLLRFRFAKYPEIDTVNNRAILISAVLAHSVSINV